MINSFKLLLFNKSFCVELCIFWNMAYTFANHPLYKMTQCLQKMELFFLFSVKNVCRLQIFIVSLHYEFFVTQNS